MAKCTNTGLYIVGETFGKYQIVKYIIFYLFEGIYKWVFHECPSINCKPVVFITFSTTFEQKKFKVLFS